MEGINEIITGFVLHSAQLLRQVTVPVRRRKPAGGDAEQGGDTPGREEDGGMSESGDCDDEDECGDVSGMGAPPLQNRLRIFAGEIVATCESFTLFAGQPGAPPPRPNVTAASRFILITLKVPKYKTLHVTGNVFILRRNCRLCVALFLPRMFLGEQTEERERALQDVPGDGGACHLWCLWVPRTSALEARMKTALPEPLVSEQNSLTLIP